MPDLQAAFEQAQADLKGLSKRPSNDDLAFLYGHYKQATQGDVTGKKPGRFDLVGRGKYDGWEAAKGLTSEEAMQAYVDKANALLG